VNQINRATNEEPFMQVKRITAPNMRQALQIVREQLGPDAIILSNRRIPNGIELICSMEAPELVASGPVMASELKSASVPREKTPLEKGISEWEQEARDRARAIELSLRQKLADKSRNDKARTDSAADFYEQRAAKLATQNRALDLPKPAATMAATTLSTAQVGAKQAPVAASQNVVNPKTVNSPAATTVRKVPAQAPGAVDLQKFTSPAVLAANSGPVFPQKPLAPKMSAATAASAETPHKPALQPQPPTQKIQAAPAVQDSKPRSSEELDALRSELQSLRSMLQGQFQHMAWMNLTQQEPARADVWKRLAKLGFSGDCIRNLLDHAKAPSASQLWHEVLKQLLGSLPVDGNDAVTKGGVFAFVGPTGAGKTTTIGKLAARAVLKHGADNVVLITTDTYRVAGHEQLRVFGRILGVQVVVVDQIDQLPAIIERHAKRHLVMVDTAGLSARDARLQKQLSVLSSMQTRIKTFLVMPCSMQRQTQERAFEVYGAATLQGMILTKLDEAASLGESLSLVMQHQLPVCYVADGQQVPQDVHVATAREIVQRAMLSRSAVAQDEGELAETYWQATQLSGAASMQVA
jgi:flagellar biosynthesis protein FlhF